ncbi:MAG TPA: arsenate reductase ArsC [Anaerolineaceae bacterium]|nr:arsenate reductase ArsC [Anaerolineaceae bacterium]
MHNPRVLFLCTGNSCRSQIAEAFLKKYAGDRFEVYSAGLDPKPINPLTIKVMEEIGMDMSGQYSKPLTLYMGKVHFGYLITVCSNAEKECPIFPGMGMRLHWSFEDPAAFEGTEEEKLAKFREVRDQIDQKVHEWALEVQTA